MELFGGIVTIQRGRLNKQTQRVETFTNEAVTFTSQFVMNIQKKIASEISKVSYNHMRYEVMPKGTDIMRSLDGSDIDEVLNWKPKGFDSSTEFWNKVVIQMFQTKKVRLKPIYKKNKYTDTYYLDDLHLINGDEEYKQSEVITLISPFYLDNDTSILDQALASITTKLEHGKLRALYKVNANIDNGLEAFKNKAMTAIQAMQTSANFNGIGVTDAKAELIELKNSYSVLNQEEIDLIKSELLSSYFMNEKILLGTASQEEQIAFYNATIIPLLFQLEKELSYKLIPSSRRRQNSQNKYYERIVIDNQLFKFASLKDLISLYHENVNAPMFTVNQFLSMIGEQPREGGDVYLTNKNSVAVENFSDLAELTKNLESEKKPVDETS